MFDIWSILEIDPTNDLGKIRKAYAKLAAQYHPEEDPDHYQVIAQAYKKAMSLARRGLVQEPTSSPSQSSFEKEISVEDPGFFQQPQEAVPDFFAEQTKSDPTSLFANENEALESESSSEQPDLNFEQLSPDGPSDQQDLDFENLDPAGSPSQSDLDFEQLDPTEPSDHPDLEFEDLDPSAPAAQPDLDFEQLNPSEAFDQPDLDFEELDPVAPTDQSDLDFEDLDLSESPSDQESESLAGAGAESQSDQGKGPQSETGDGPEPETQQPGHQEKLLASSQSDLDFSSFSSQDNLAELHHDFQQLIFSGLDQEKLWHKFFDKYSQSGPDLLHLLEKEDVFLFKDWALIRFILHELTEHGWDQSPYAQRLSCWLGFQTRHVRSQYAEPAYYHSFEVAYQKNLLLKQVISSPLLINDQALWDEILQIEDVKYPYLDGPELFEAVKEKMAYITDPRLYLRIHSCLYQLLRRTDSGPGKLEGLSLAYVKNQASAGLRFSYRWFKKVLILLLLLLAWAIIDSFLGIFSHFSLGQILLVPYFIWLGIFNIGLLNPFEGNLALRWWRKLILLLPALLSLWNYFHYAPQAWIYFLCLFLTLVFLVRESYHKN